MTKLCLHAFNIAYPYCLTISNKGRFKWVKKREGVIAQCPGTKNSIVMEIKNEKNKVVIDIIDVRGVCPNKHRIGEKFKFNTKDFVWKCKGD